MVIKLKNNEGFRNPCQLEMHPETRATYLRYHVLSLIYA